MNKTLINYLNNTMVKLPSPINISYWWNYGSLLGLFLMVQFVSGLLLSMHYCPNTILAFSSIIHIMQNVNQGWLIHNIHVNGASMFFICLYAHLARGLYYHSFNLKNTWLIGVTIFVMSMATAFLGYVLPWGQMSFWGATVITNLITTIPYMGPMIVEWLWGGFSINNATLNRFFSFHFLLPFMILLFIMFHLLYLHETGSKNPLGINSNLNKIAFHTYFTMKDTLGFSLLLTFFMVVNLQYPYLFSDPDNFSQANPMITPIHIQPEWYFLFAYAILRSIPNKLGGVIALVMSIIILYTLSTFNFLMKSNKHYPINQMMYWMFINTFILLTFMGALPIEYPFMDISQLLSILYFMYFIMNYLTYSIWDNIMYPHM